MIKIVTNCENGIRAKQIKNKSMEQREVISDCGFRIADFKKGHRGISNFGVYYTLESQPKVAPTWQASFKQFL